MPEEQDEARKRRGHVADQGSHGRGWGGVGDRRDAKHGRAGRRRHPHPAASPAAVRASLRGELKDYLNSHRGVEHISAVSLAVTFRGGGSGINLAVGSTRYGGGPTMSPYALWQIGSNTKAFTSVLVLQLEAEHKLSIDDTLGKWLPRVPGLEWRDDQAAVEHDQRHPGLHGLVGLLERGRVGAQWSVLHGPIGLLRRGPSDHAWLQLLEYQLHPGADDHRTCEPRSCMGDVLRNQILDPLGLQNTYYSATAYGRAITDRMPAGYWFISELPMMTSQLGEDQSRLTVSWAQGAGAMVSSLQDLGNWDRALFTGQELPTQQQRELTSLVSTTTGEPIRHDDAGRSRWVRSRRQPGDAPPWGPSGTTRGKRMVTGW